jgi:hypothetical protein
VHGFFPLNSNNHWYGCDKSDSIYCAFSPSPRSKGNQGFTLYEFKVTNNKLQNCKQPQRVTAVIANSNNEKIFLLEIQEGFVSIQFFDIKPITFRLKSPV